MNRDSYITMTRVLASNREEQAHAREIPIKEQNS
jgi:hypothetical protein